jgi:hypothetical protein
MERQRLRSGRWRIGPTSEAGDGFTRHGVFPPVGATFTEFQPNEKTTAWTTLAVQDASAYAKLVRKSGNP